MNPGAIKRSFGISAHHFFFFFWGGHLLTDTSVSLSVQTGTDHKSRAVHRSQDKRVTDKTTDVEHRCEDPLMLGVG